MNYTSINELLTAGTSNMINVQNNAYGTKEIEGVNWFTFNGVVVDKLYFDADSYVGFGSSEQHLKINYHTNNISNGFYREEGTLYGRYKFLKIRRYGYTVMSGNHPDSQLIGYDLILWDTGDISLYIFKKPTVGNTGEYSITSTTTQSYTTSTHTTFTKADEGFQIENKVIELDEKRYLVRSNSTYYTIIDGVLSEISIDELTSDVFLTFGSTILPDIELTFELSNPDILFWSEDAQIALDSQLTVSFTPPLPQVLYSETYTVPEDTLIDRVIILDSQDTLVSLTFDSGLTWKHYHDGSWVVTDSETDGMTVDVLNNLSADQWEDVAPCATFQVRCSLMSTDSQVGEIYFNLAQTATEA